MAEPYIGEFEEMLLLAAHGLGTEAYGIAVRNLVERETGRTVSLGPVYTALDRLELKGLLRSRTVDGTPTRGGRRRRVFMLTAAGLRALTALQAARARLYRHAGLDPAGTRS